MSPTLTIVPTQWTYHGLMMRSLEAKFTQEMSPVYWCLETARHARQMLTRQWRFQVNINGLWYLYSLYEVCCFFGSQLICNPYFNRSIIHVLTLVFMQAYGPTPVLKSPLIESY